MSFRRRLRRTATEMIFDARVYRQVSRGRRDYRVKGLERRPTLEPLEGSMKRSIGLGLVFAVMLTGCTTGAGNYSSAGLAPIPGSITYSGQPRTKLTKSPVGSSFPHTFTDQWGRQTEEIYIIRPDRSLLIAERHYRPVFALDDD